MLRATFQHLRSLFAGLTREERLVLVVVALLHGVGLGWGLPSSDSWDNDGVAPRDFLPGLLKTFTQGDYYTYPPLQLLLLALLTLPVTVFALARAGSLSQEAVVRSFLDPHVMTAFTVAARAMSFVQSMGIVFVMGELAALIAKDRRARVYGMALAGLEVTLTYYAHTTNLDVPYLFWATLALLAFARAKEGDAPKGLRRAAIFAAFAVATKDQAYALFMFSIPPLAVAWLWQRRTRARELVRELAVAVLLTFGVVLLIDGAFYNPRGFVARLRFLLGPASQDFAQYAKTLRGAAAAFADVWRSFPVHYPAVFALLFAAGVLIAIWPRRDAEGRRRDSAVALLPALGALSFTLGFNCWARRVEERFEMPQMVLVSVYGAVALAALERWVRGRSRPARVAFGLLCSAALLLALRQSAAVVAVMLDDPRYQVEDFLAAKLASGDGVEVYGRNVYLPRFAAGTHVWRVGPDEVGRRNPMPGIVEVEAPYGAIAQRKPRFVVVGAGFAWRYRIGRWDGDAGRVQPVSHSGNLTDTDATAFFQSLFAGTAGYREVLHARREGRVFPTIELHASLGMQVYVFERDR